LYQETSAPLLEVVLSVMLASKTAGFDPNVPARLMLEVVASLSALH
jgi:hypothetical protein